MSRHDQEGGGIHLGHIVAATRIPFAAVSVMPVLFAGIWTWYYRGLLDIPLFAAAVCGVLFVHLGANTINDYADWNRSDRNNPYAGPFNGGSRYRLGHVLSRKTFLAISCVCFGAGAAAGLYILHSARPYTLLFLDAGIGAALIYSLPPFSLHSRGAGEAVIFAAFGPLLMSAAGYVLSGTVNPVYMLLGIPNGILTVLILWVNEFPDADADTRAGKRNLVVRLGPEKAVWAWPVLFICFYGTVAALWFAGILPPASLFLLLLIPLNIIYGKRFFAYCMVPEKLEGVQKHAVMFHAAGSGYLLLILTISVFSA